MHYIEKLEQSSAENKVLEQRVAALSEGESTALEQLSTQLAAAEEERARAGGEVEQMKALLREADAERTRLGEEKEQLAAEVQRLEGAAAAAAAAADAQREEAKAERDAAALSATAEGSVLEEALAARERAEAEVTSMQESGAAVSKRIVALLEAMGLPPQGDKVERLDAASTQVRCPCRQNVFCC